MRTFILGLVLFFGYSASLEDTPKTMNKIVVQLDAPDLPQDSFARKPKVIYRAGSRYCRVEEAADPANNMHNLLIVNEPDAWMVNLLSRKAQHVTDRGPTFNCHLPVFSGPVPGTSDDLDYAKLGLEFGHELEFFKKAGATPQPGPVLQTKNTTAYKLDRGNTRLALFTYGPNDFPLLIGHTVGGKGELYWYSAYGEIPFDPKLFTAPDGLRVEEAKH